MNPEISDLLFTGTSKTIENIIEMHNKHKMEGFPLKVRVSFAGSFKEQSFLSPNVVGMIEGNDPKLRDNYVLVSAHYDHLGIGKSVQGDSIYNGVFDNASGTSALIEIARIISEYNLSTKRSIIFLLTTAEEFGLLGSEYYIQNPVVPLYKTIANINIDGIASYDNFKSVIGIGAEYSSLKNDLNKIARERNLRIRDIPLIFSQTDAFSQSDQISFAKAGIPSILIYEGMDYENISNDAGLEMMINYMQNIYHTPFDDLSQPINYDAVIQHVEFLLGMVLHLANNDNEPEWNNGVIFKNERLRTRAEKR
jgi:Zn-dependent M28 family amino/carboxypeptidase